MWKNTTKSCLIKVLLKGIRGREIEERNTNSRENLYFSRGKNIEGRKRKAF